MKILRAALLVVLVAPALVVVGSTSALACSCIPARPDKAAVEEAAAVFSGTVAKIEPGVDIGFDRVTWTFAVEEVYKGDVAEMQDVSSHTQSAACGLVFKEGKRYLVFAYVGDEDLASNEDLATNSCMNTRPLSGDREPKLEPIASFEKTASPGPIAGEGPAEEPSGWDPFVVGALGALAVAVIVSVAALVTGRRQKT